MILYYKNNKMLRKFQNIKSPKISTFIFLYSYPINLMSKSNNSNPFQNKPNPKYKIK